jgi:acetyl-CoA carboxylase carboxyltransferase component
VLVRKSYGLAYFSLGGNDTGVDSVYAWPGAEISFMDPLVAANVVSGGDPAARDAALDAMQAQTDPYGAAGRMAIDEIIDPADTRATLARALQRLDGRPRVNGWERPLASWPAC